MKKLTLITLVLSLILSACLLCSCSMPTQAADTAGSNPQGNPGGAPPSDTNAFVIGGDPGYMTPANDMRAQQPTLTEGAEIIEVYIPSASVTQSIRPLFDYGGGVIKSEKQNGEEPVKTYPVTVEFQGDMIKINYYVESGSDVAQRSIVTGKDNVIIYMK